MPTIVHHTLRDGSRVRDARLNRLQQFDPRSRNFSITPLLAGVSLRSYTWACPIVLDQGPDGACVGFSMAHELAARPVRVDGLTDRYAKEQIYWAAQRIDEWAGGSYPGASPVYEGTSVLAGVKVLRSLGFIKEYRWAFSIEDLAAAVGHIGPAVLGIPWYDGMYEPGSCGRLHVTGDPVGGHAILCRGVSVKDRTFTLHNSWGPGWGGPLPGCAKISWDELDRLLHEGGEACIPMSRDGLIRGV